MSNQRGSTIQIWPITDAIFGKDIGSELQERLAAFSQGTPKFVCTRNGKSLRASGKAPESSILIEMSRHNFPNVGSDRDSRYLNVHLPEGVDPHEVLEQVRGAVKDLVSRRPDADLPELHVAFVSPDFTRLDLKQTISLRPPVSQSPTAGPQIGR